jgi:drug/metabolite transporter (DMT)-like permease
VGEIVALLVSVCWTLTSVELTLVAQHIGSEETNRARLAIGVVALSLVHLVLYGRLLPTGAGAARWWWLGLSGVLGMVIGDSCLFRAFLLIGPRRSELLMTLAPVISTALGWVWLGERLRPVELVALAMVLAGIGWVVGELPRAEVRQSERGRAWGRGVLMGLCGALGQAVGVVAAKQGLGGDFPALSGTVIRIFVSAAVVWAVTILQGNGRSSIAALTSRAARWHMLRGSLLGPVVGVWLSMVAVQLVPVGIASTLMGLSPVFLVPVDRWVFREAVTPRSVAGTVVALAGAALLFVS